MSDRTEIIDTAIRDLSKVADDLVWFQSGPAISEDVEVALIAVRNAVDVLKAWKRKQEATS